jgi:hypothetical protein
MCIFSVHIDVLNLYVGVDVYVKRCLLDICDDDVRQCLCFVRCDHNDDSLLEY